MKYWEIIADNLSKAAWSWGCVSAIDSNGRRSGLQTPTATTESVLLYAQRKSQLNLLNRNQRFLRARSLSRLPLQNFRTEFAVADASANFHLWPNYCSCPYDLAAIVHGDAVTAAQRRVGS
jgi:hypothetical protein